MDRNIVASYTVPVDFNHRETDGSIRLTTEPTMQFIVEHCIQLTGGSPIHISDGEFTALGVLEQRDGVWIASSLKWKPF
ncbi:MAG: hypothetical protein AAF438_10920 [Pseudomonadota bacterium]